VPAAAVIPARRRNTIFVAVKKLVVEHLRPGVGHGGNLVSCARAHARGGAGSREGVRILAPYVTVNKTDRSWKVFAPERLARNNTQGFPSFSLVWDGGLVNRNGWGYLYCRARGEILGLRHDKRLRKHLPRMFSLIKNESSGIEDD